MLKECPFLFITNIKFKIMEEYAKHEKDLIRKYEAQAIPTILGMPIIN